MGSDRWNFSWKAKQLITRHGNFKVYLVRFRLRDVEVNCEYSKGVQSAEHVWKRCERVEIVVQRQRLKEELKATGVESETKKKTDVARIINGIVESVVDSERIS